MTSDGRISRQQGVLTRWNDDRGFGFIEPAAGGSRVFVHVSALPNGWRPVDGCEVTYVVVRDERHRTGAEDVRHRGVSPAGGAGAMGAPSRTSSRHFPVGTIFWFTVIASCAAITWFVLATRPRGSGATRRRGRRRRWDR